jgi:dihydroorotate dehydrogenase electron transfer subunit
MIQETCSVRRVEKVAENVYVLTFASEQIARFTSAGQFVNIKTGEGLEPLFRRPFSVYDVQECLVQIIFNVIGKGTATLRQKKAGETIDVIGLLGVPFTLDGNGFDTAILIGGGLGVAPLPLATRELQRLGKRIITFLGARTASMLVEQHLVGVRIATDDGSKGFHGNVVDLMQQELPSALLQSTKVFACGPTPMLRALQAFVLKNNIQCEASLEGPMGCGFGVCQGCPVELVGGEKKYALMCKDGPTFDMSRRRL